MRFPQSSGVDRSPVRPILRQSSSRVVPCSAFAPGGQKSGLKAGVKTCSPLYFTLESGNEL